MNKDDVLKWLNHRLNLIRSKQNVIISDEDIVFIRVYIDHYKQKLIQPAEIINAIQRRPVNVMLYHLDFMINKLIVDFNITTKVTKSRMIDFASNLAAGRHPHAEVEVDMIENYS